MTIGGAVDISMDVYVDGAAVEVTVVVVGVASVL